MFQYQYYDHVLFKEKIMCKNKKDEKIKELSYEWNVWEKNFFNFQTFELLSIIFDMGHYFTFYLEIKLCESV